MKVVLLLILVLALICEGKKYPFYWKTSDEIHVFLLDNPLATTAAQTKWSSLERHNSAIGFVNKRTDEKIEVFYAPSGSVLSSVFPKIVDQDGKEKLVWDNSATVRMTDSMRAGWKVNEQVMKIDGKILQRFLCTLGVYESSHEVVNLFEMNEDTLINWISSSSTSDFVWHSFRTLYNLGAEETLLGRVSRNFFTIIGDKPQKIDFEKHREELLEFYSEFALGDKEDTIESVFMHALNAFNGTFYYYSGKAYYKTVLRSPFVSVRYEPTPITSGERNEDEVEYVPNCLKEGSDLSFGSILLIMFAVAVPLYCAIGVIYKSQVLKATGRERIPNSTFWFSLPSLVKGGFTFTIALITAPFRRTRNPSYEHVNSTYGSL